MHYLLIPPCKELKDLVSHFWVAVWNEQVQPLNSTYYRTASSLTEIIFAFKGSRQDSQLLFSSIQGHTCHHGQFPAGGFFELFGVSLHSYAIPCLFNLQACELNNQFLSPDTLFGNEGKILTEKIACASSTQERINIMSDYLKLRLAKQRYEDKSITHAIKYIREYKGMVNIANLSSQFCLSQKQFERRFKAYAGFSPKLYARIVRFEKVLASYTSYTNFTQAAHGYGYYDQAHFIHDFKAFSGFSPKKFFELSGY